MGSIRSIDPLIHWSTDRSIVLWSIDVKLNRSSDLLITDWSLPSPITGVTLSNPLTAECWTCEVSCTFLHRSKANYIVSINSIEEETFPADRNLIIKCLRQAPPCWVRRCEVSRFAYLNGGRCDSTVSSLLNFQNFLLEFAGFAEFESLDTMRCCQILRCRI